MLEQIPVLPQTKRGLKSRSRRHQQDPSENDSNMNLVISTRRLLMSQSKRYRVLGERDRWKIYQIPRHRFLMNSLSADLDGGEMKVHALIWLKASGSLGQKLANPGYYSQLKNCKDLLYPNYDFKQIELDVSRTYPHVQDQKDRLRLEGQLRNVLHCFVKRNAKIGYFQGMNFIASHLLTVI